MSGVRPSLVIGPLMRYVDETSAAIWVETDRDSTVTATVGAGSWSARTFRVHGHHYALVEVSGLQPGSVLPYEIWLDGTCAWPVPDDRTDLDLPPSVISTLKPGKPLRLAFGSCRTSVSHDESGNAAHGVDALRAYALAMAGVSAGPGELAWPDLCLFLGDQVYADITSPEMKKFIATRRSLDEPPGEELQDYEEYAHLYRLAWSDPANRWLLSTLPSAMIFDDHDVRDDWNTSAAWRSDMERTSWWHGRIVAGLASYWVYQHIGNLSPTARAEDEVWQQVVAHATEDELDLTDVLDNLAAEADRDPERYRWSFARDIAGCRLVVVDSRAARVLEEDRRAMLDTAESAWLDERMCGDVEHLLIGTSLPVLLAPGLHNLEAVVERLAGRRRPWAVAVADRVRRRIDLEHWAAFNESFCELTERVRAVADGERGRAPRTVMFLSGDVHHSYVAEAVPIDGARVRARILQAVCSPIRNPLPRGIRVLTAFLAGRNPRGVTHKVAAAVGVRQAPFEWEITKGPWYDNNLATLEVTEAGLDLWWAAGDVESGTHERPRLTEVARVHVDA